MRFLYGLALHVLALFYLLRGRRYWKRLKVRLGVGFPKVEKGNRPLIWVHAVSLGETKAISSLVKRVKKMPGNPLILLSTATETGFEEGKRSIPEADYHVYLPWDFGYIIQPIVKQVSPEMVILTETDFWWNFQDAAKACGSSLVLVNGKISLRSFGRMLRFPFLAKALLHRFDLLCVQGELYAKRFRELGILDEKIKVTGNIKLDGFSPEKKSSEWKEKLGLQEEDLVLTLGSTHDPEEKILLNLTKELFLKFPQLKVLLVPRHPERFDEVEKLLQKGGFSYSRLSQKVFPRDQRVILVDQMGSLRKCYQVSDVAFVGGSLAPGVGGHNILEPAFYGIPVVFGPFMESQPDFLEAVLSYQAGVQVDEKGILRVLKELLEDPLKRNHLGQNGLRLVREGQGGVDRTLQAMISCDKIEARDRIFSLSRDGAVVSSLGS